MSTNLKRDLLDKLINDFTSSDFLIQDGQNGYLQNHEALEYLKLKQSQLQNIATIASDSGYIGSASIPMQFLAGVTRNYPVNELLIPVERLVMTIETLLEEFKEEGITLTPFVQTEEGLIDLFVKTSDRKSFGLILRSNGDSKVKWREERSTFFVTRKKGTSKWPELDPIACKLNSMMNCLRSKESLLLGSSKNERKKAFIKTIVLTGKTRLDPTNDPARWVNFGRTTALRMNLTSTYFLVDRANLVNFFKKPLESVQDKA
jgi:hypothetical protein